MAQKEEIGYIAKDPEGDQKQNEDNGSSGTESLSPAKFLAIPPDGGWGWVIVVASFLINGLVDGLAAIFGVFQPEFLKAFGASRGKTALAGSLMAGMFMISGPVVSGLVNNYGCRIVTIIGSFVAASAYVLATFSPNIDVLILTYGVMAGIGVGMFYLPGMVMVSFYFERRRALATGIACSGAGFGMVVLAPVSAALLSVMSWQNSLFVISGITLIAVFLGILMRPLKNPEITPETSESYEEPLMDKNDVESPGSERDDTVPNGGINADDNGKEQSQYDSHKGSLNALRKSLSHHQSISPTFSHEIKGHSEKDPTAKDTHVVYDPTQKACYSSTPVIPTPFHYTDHDEKDRLNPDYLKKKKVPTATLR